jgi:hypothetical protein
MKEDGQKSKQAKMTEELEKAKYTVEECKRQLIDRRKQIESWKNKIDKGCIERIRSFQNPPIILGQIIEMTIALIGKKRFPEIQSAKIRDPNNEGQNKDDKADGSKTPKSKLKIFLFAKTHRVNNSII